MIGIVSYQHRNVYLSGNYCIVISNHQTPEIPKASTHRYTQSPQKNSNGTKAAAIRHGGDDDEEVSPSIMTTANGISSRRWITPITAVICLPRTNLMIHTPHYRTTLPVRNPRVIRCPAALHLGLVRAADPGQFSREPFTSISESASSQSSSSSPCTFAGDTQHDASENRCANIRWFPRKAQGSSWRFAWLFDFPIHCFSQNHWV